MVENAVAESQVQAPVRCVFLGKSIDGLLCSMLAASDLDDRFKSKRGLHIEPRKKVGCGIAGSTSKHRERSGQRNPVSSNTRRVLVCGIPQRTVHFHQGTAIPRSRAGSKSSTYESNSLIHTISQYCVWSHSFDRLNLCCWLYRCPVWFANAGEAMLCDALEVFFHVIVLSAGFCSRVQISATLMRSVKIAVWHAERSVNEPASRRDQ